jgi:hypothetical protein
MYNLILDAGSYNIMVNSVNIVGDIGCGNYEVTWANRYVESEIFNSYSHPLPVIGKIFKVITEQNFNSVFYLRWKITNKKHKLLLFQECYTT